jgi:hypothetical protein
MHCKQPGIVSVILYCEQYEYIGALEAGKSHIDYVINSSADVMKKTKRLCALARFSDLRE